MNILAKRNKGTSWQRGTKEHLGKEEQSHLVARRNRGTSWQRGTKEICGKEEQRNLVAKRNKGNSWQRGTEELRGKEKRRNFVANRNKAPLWQSSSQLQKLNNKRNRLSCVQRNRLRVAFLLFASRTLQASQATQNLMFSALNSCTSKIMLKGQPAILVFTHSFTIFQFSNLMSLNYTKNWNKKCRQKK